MKSNLICVAFLIFVGLLLNACSSKMDANGGTVTTYGFSVENLDLNQPIDSILVLVILNEDTVQNKTYFPASLKDSLLVLEIAAAEGTPLRVLYWVYAGGVPVAGGDQDFVSGETEVAYPELRPVAIAGADTLVYRGHELQLVGSVSKNVDKITHYAWDYEGDGTFNDEFERNKDFVYTYADTGTYYAIFRITNTLGLQGLDTVKITVKNSPPTIQSFIVPSRVVSGNTAKMEINANSEYGTIVNYQWDLGGDGIWDTAGAHLSLVEHRLFVLGFYSVIIGITDSEGNLLLDTAKIEVSARAGSLPPEITLLYQTDSVVSVKDTVGWRVDFSDDNARADVVEFAWDLDGDGIYETIKKSPDSLSHVYNTVGTYRISVKITDTGGERATASKTVRVVQGVPTVTLDANKTSAGIGELVTFTATAIDLNETAKDGNIVQYDWDFDGDGVYDKSTKVNTVSFAYPDAYESHLYKVKVQVTDDDGNIAEDNLEVTVANRAPTISAITLSSTGAVLRNMKVALSVADRAFADADGNKVDMLYWDLDNDGEYETSGNGATPQNFIQSNVGTYTVKVKGCDKWNACATRSLDIMVNNGFQDPRDGEFYSMETINGVTWMASNLNYSGHTGLNEYAAGKTYSKGRCYGVGSADTTQHQDSTTCNGGYGRLYNWTTAMGLNDKYLTATTPTSMILTPHQGICPTGWHIPTDAEWTALSLFMGESTAGTKMRSTTGWGNNGNSTDDFGFSGLPAGGHDDYGNWSGRTFYTYYWSATEDKDNNAWYLKLGYNIVTASLYNYKKTEGHSLRCVKN